MQDAKFVFSYNEKHVFGPDDQSNGFMAWDTQTGKLVKSFPNGTIIIYSVHNRPIRCIASSGTEPGIMTCGYLVIDLGMTGRAAIGILTNDLSFSANF